MTMICINCGKEMRRRGCIVLTFPPIQEYDCVCGLVIDEQEGERRVCRQSKVKREDIKGDTI